MNLTKKISVDLNDSQIDNQISILKINALWAFSESTFGGILHALKIPMRGIFLNAAAVLFISMIAYFSKNSKEILKSTLAVILIKASVSPHSPLTAYFAVAVQGLIGTSFSFQKIISAYRHCCLVLSRFFFPGYRK